MSGVAPPMSAADVIAGLQISPSILAADFARLGHHVDQVLAAGARVIHIDVMDGHFVPPITIGAAVVEALADRIHDAGAVADVHLMMDSGANLLVTGSAIFGQPDAGEAYRAVLIAALDG